MEKIPKKVLTIRRVYSILVIVLRNKNTTYATVAQLVEYDLAKVGVAGSNPVVRSMIVQARRQTDGLFSCLAPNDEG